MSHWLRNVLSFGLTEQPTVTLEQLEETVQSYAFRGIAPLEKEHRGFVPIQGQERLVHEVSGTWWLQVKAEHKKVPGATLKKRLAEKIDEIAQKEGRKVGRKEKKELKEMLSDELLAKVLPVPSQVLLVVDPAAGQVLVGTSSAKVAEAALSLLVRACGGLKLTRWEPERGISSQMTDLLIAEDSGEFVADSALVLKSQDNSGSTVRFSNCNLSEPEIGAYLAKGMTPASLALTWDDRISVILTDTLGLRKITYLEQMSEELELLADTDPLTQLNGILALQVGELRGLFAGLKGWLGLSAAKIS